MYPIISLHQQKTVVNLNICADLSKVVARRLDPGDGDPDQLEIEFISS